MAGRSASLAPAFLAATLLTACHRLPAPTMPHESPAAVLEAQRASSGPRSIRAAARVDQRGREGRVRGNVLMFMERPDRVRFDAMTRLGPAAILTSDGERFQLLDMRESRFLEGPTCPSNIARLLGLAMRGEDVARFLVGDAPRVAGEASSLAVIRGGYRVTLGEEGEVRQVLTVHVHEDDLERAPEAQRLRLVKVETFDAAGEPLWRAAFDDHREVRSEAGEVFTLPFALQFEDLRREAEVVVRFEEIAVNVSVPEGAFSQPVPGGLRPETVSCAPGE